MIPLLQVVQEPIPDVELSKIEYQEVIFTNYYPTDGSSGTVTASGLSTADFQINEEQFYTYNGYVVLATANTTRLARILYPGYRSHELYEIIHFQINGKDYIGQVLDVCGACFGVSSELKQRYDIFTSQSTFGKAEGIVQSHKGE